jgi:hypothetical protein
MNFNTNQLTTADNDKSFFRATSFGRGMSHVENEIDVLPPALRLTRSLTNIIAAWVTAEQFIGNLDELHKNSPSGGKN